MARIVNKKRRKFRKTRFLGDYYEFTELRKVYSEEKSKYEQSIREKAIKNMKDGNNIWNHVKHAFRPYSPSFKGLTVDNNILSDNQSTVNRLANYYKEHFS